MSRPRSRLAGPAGYEAIERVLVRMACGAGVAELRRDLSGIEHPAARRALALLVQGRPAGAEAVLEDALEAMAGAEDGAGLKWFAGFSVTDRAA